MNDGGSLVVSSDGEVVDEGRHGEGKIMAWRISSGASWNCAMA
jgi:hypothetical protein